MRNLVLITVCFLSFASSFSFAGDDVTVVRTADINLAKDAVFKHRARKARIKVVVPKHNRFDRRVWVKDYIQSYNSLLDEIKKEDPKLAEKLAEDPTNVLGTVRLLEEYLGLDEVNPPKLSLVERCRRIVWVEQIYQPKYAEGVEIVFE